MLLRGPTKQLRNFPPQLLFQIFKLSFSSFKREELVLVSMVKFGGKEYHPYIKLDIDYTDIRCLKAK